MRPYEVIDPNLVASSDQTEANTDVATDLTNNSSDNLGELAFSTDTSSQVSASLDNVPSQAEGLVPSDVPPDGLPQAALTHMSLTAVEQLTKHAAWLIPDSDELRFSTTDAVSQSSPPLDNVPPQAEGHVPSDLLPDGLQQDVLDTMSVTAVAELADYADWLIS